MFLPSKDQMDSITRDLFAGQALNTILTEFDYARPFVNDEHSAAAAKAAYDIADAMMLERAKRAGK